MLEKAAPQDEAAPVLETAAPEDPFAFEIGGRSLVPSELNNPDGDPDKRRRQIDEFIAHVQERVGTLLRVDNVAFLLGAGASRGAGGVTLGAVPVEIERQLVDSGFDGEEPRDWLRLFYAAARRVGKLTEPRADDEVLAERGAALRSGTEVTPLQANFEALLSLLWQWRAAVRYDDLVAIEDLDARLSKDVLDECLSRSTRALAEACALPRGSGSLDTHREFLRKALLRPPTSNRISLFTVNYDTLLEQAADAEGIVLLDGFVGTLRRVFRPESYDREIHMAQHGQPLAPIDRLIRLYKLHGSINWRSDPAAEWVNPHGVYIGTGTGDSAEIPLVYPTPSKVGETLGMPYAELFRRFAATVVRQQTTLFVCGYGFGDRHVNEVLYQALTVPTFSLAVVEPRPPKANAAGGFVARLRALNDPRVWIIGGTDLGTFAGFVARALPDLRGENVESLIARTFMALRGTRTGEVS